MADDYSAYAHIGRIASELRAQGKKIVFTNGCFDLLHPGHIDILRRARALGGALIVGLNSDKSVRRLKGASRPLIPEDLRRQSLEELRCVDAVAVFEEDTPIELIKVLRPDVLVKGSDYSRDTVVGAEIVEEYGGKVELLPLVPGFSTTELIRKLSEMIK